ncbi:MAG: flagellar hook-basal body protein [Phycisphaerales bacterium JB063]
MKPLHLPALTISALLPTLALTGCTVHNHYYGTAKPAQPSIAASHETPGQTILADQLAGIHTAIEVASTNLANANTIGYKARRATFIEGHPHPTVTIDWTTGSPQITDRPLDIYIEGNGFFRVEIDEDVGGGVAYTRRGNFFVNRDGEIVLGNANGPRLNDGIHVSGDVVSISVAPDGLVHTTHPDNSVSNIGQIMLYTFVAPDGLESHGNGLFIETDASGPSHRNEPGWGQCGKLAQGMIENSNVNVISTWVELKKLGYWADAIAEEIGLSESQRYTLAAPADAITPDQSDILLSHDH